MSGPDETTDKLFPPPERAPHESGIVERPIPMAPSIRQEFLAYRLHFDRELAAFRAELGTALGQMAPVTHRGALEKVKGGMLAGLRYGGVALALGEAGAQVARAMGRPEIEGPIRAMISLVGG